MSADSDLSPSVLVRDAPEIEHPSSRTSERADPLEPSMEEILASIRKIIADDHGPAMRAAPPPPPSPAKRSAPLWAPLSAFSHAPASAPRPVGRIEPSLQPAAPAPTDLPPRLDVAPPPPVEPHRLEPSAIVEPPQPPVAAMPEPVPPVAHHWVEEPAPMPPAAEPAHPPALAEGESMLSSTSKARVASSLQALTTTVMMQNTKMIESTIRDMLRPMLKEWLDDNLPPIVEQVVRDEIERVARGS